MTGILWNKKGELTTQQIVVLIILITSFVILMFFLFRLNLQETTDKEICRNSVVLKGKSILPSETTPLKCKTNYVCITEDGSCEDLNYYSYKITVSDKGEMYSALADEMADCWWMFGEGEVNYVGKDLTKELYCSVCSQIVFDDSVKNIKEFSDGYLDKNDFYFNYLAKEKISGKGKTYAEYLLGTNDVGKILENAQKVSESEDVDYGEINFNERHAIIMGVSSDVSKLRWTLSGAGLGLAVVGILLTPLTGGLSVGLVSGALIISGGTATGTLAGVTIEGLSGDKYIAPIIIAFPKDYDKLDCDHIVTLG